MGELEGNEEEEEEEEGQEHVAYVGGCRRGGWRDGSIDVHVCACTAGVAAHSLLCQHPNIMLVKKNNT